jgi:HAD superfamily hydrolase (TIGR01490 family)
MSALVAKTAVVAFFDLDWTILRANSGASWMRRWYRDGRLSTWQFLKAVGYVLGYRANLVDMHEAQRKALQLIAGRTEVELCREIRQWFVEEMADEVAPGALHTIEAHRRLGHGLVLLTSVSNYEAEIAAETYGFDDYLSCRYELKDGVFTGSTLLPLCYGDGKLIHAERYARRECIDLGQCYFYTDSWSDLLMLQRVGYPRVVNPDPQLRLTAWRRKWPILAWGHEEP